MATNQKKKKPSAYPVMGSRSHLGGCRSLPSSTGSKTAKKSTVAMHAARNADQPTAAISCARRDHGCGSVGAWLGVIVLTLCRGLGRDRWAVRSGYGLCLGRRHAWRLVVVEGPFAQAQHVGGEQPHACFAQ